MSTSRTFAGPLTAAQMNDLPQGRLGSAQATADQGSITVEVDLTSLTVTATVVAGRRVKITGICYMQNTTVGATNTLKIQQDGVQLAEGTVLSSSASLAQTVVTIAVVSPSAGSHTWKLRAVTTGTATMRASSTFPALILVEDIGV